MVNINDVAGNQAARHLINHFCKNANCVLLCYDISNESSFERLSSWHEDLTNDFASIPIALLALKSDLSGRGKRVVSEYNGEKKKKEFNCFHFQEVSTFTRD